jgi:hypothetical protein
LASSRSFLACTARRSSRERTCLIRRRCCMTVSPRVLRVLSRMVEHFDRKYAARFGHFKPKPRKKRPWRVRGLTKAVEVEISRCVSGSSVGCVRIAVPALTYVSGKPVSLRPSKRLGLPLSLFAGELFQGPHAPAGFQSAVG